MEKEIIELLGKHFCKGNGINLQTPYYIEKVDALELIVPSRIDLVAKYLYIYNYEKKLNSDFLIELYDKHIAAFTHGTYAEPGNNMKKSKSDYHKVFEHLIDSIKFQGYDENISIIPVGADYGILDGAHRVACCAYFNKKIRIVRFPEITLDFGYKFFEEKCLDKEYLNYMLLIYSLLKKDVYVANIWPIASDIHARNKISKLISEYGKIIVQKDISLTYLGYRNYMLQIYQKHDWVGTFDNHFKGVMSKVDACYSECNPLRIYVFECASFEKVLQLKNEVRSLFKIGNHSIHISDNRDESVQMLEILLNANSLDLINNCKPDDFQTISNIIINRQKAIDVNSMFDVNHIIMGDAILSLYGIKDTMNYSIYGLNESNSDIEKCCNISELQINELIIDPRKYCCYFGLKFISAKELINLKDLIDISDFDIAKLEEKVNSFVLETKINWKNRAKRKLKKCIKKIVGCVIIVSRKFYLYETILRIYRRLKGIKR